MFNLIDLFSGVGGLAQGFKETKKFNTLLANDIDEDMCMSFDSLSRITKLKAVIFVPLNGRIGEGELIQKWCKKNNIKLVEIYPGDELSISLFESFGVYL